MEGKAKGGDGDANQDFLKKWRGEPMQDDTVIGLFTALLKISPLAFSDIFHRISGPQVLNSDEARFGGYFCSANSMQE